MTLCGCEVCDSDVITCRAGVSGITAFGTGRSGNYYRVIMTVSGKHGSIAADLRVTDDTVNNLVVMTVVYTIGISRVLYKDLAADVTLCGGNNGLAAESPQTVQ